MNKTNDYPSIFFIKHLYSHIFLKFILPVTMQYSFSERRPCALPYILIFYSYSMLTYPSKRTVRSFYFVGHHKNEMNVNCTMRYLCKIEKNIYQV